MDLGPVELIIIAVIVFLLFGAKKLPSAAKSVGQSLRIFKEETKGLNDATPQTPPAPAALPPAAPASPPVDASVDTPVETPQPTPQV
jgi:sec-independent protein translocase protein TatA